MKARLPAFDFTNTPVHWSANPEFAQRMNASSIIIPHLERFLNRVMAKALTTLKDERHAKLRAEVRTFIRQESNHYATHQRQAEMLKRDGYDIAELDAWVEAEYARLFETKSLAFLCAYCDGFETLGPITAKIWLDNEISELIGSADPEIVSMWMWHLTEEFEHRSVCFDVFHAVHGGYFLRIRAFIAQLMHFKKMITRVTNHLLEWDRKSMSEAERIESVAREKAAEALVAKAMKPKLLKVLSPTYNPRYLPEPENYQKYLAKFEPVPA
ncbi:MULTISPECIES: metal-dependent hydrolase [unclassified Sphingobium]|uniref:metal-dependent hydrolase n=1 Tax=unclassified Sphingobium TaxID=2611147 RepID=UPI0035A59B40